MKKLFYFISILFLFNNFLIADFIKYPEGKVYNSKNFYNYKTKKLEENNKEIFYFKLDKEYNYQFFINDKDFKKYKNFHIVVTFYDIRNNINTKTFTNIVPNNINTLFKINKKEIYKIETTIKFKDENNIYYRNKIEDFYILFNDIKINSFQNLKDKNFIQFNQKLKLTILSEDFIPLYKGNTKELYIEKKNLYNIYYCDNELKRYCNFRQFKINY